MYSKRVSYGPRTADAIMRSIEPSITDGGVRLHPGLGPLVFAEHAARVTGNKETKLQELMSIGWFWPIGFTLGVHFLPDLLTMHGVAAKRVEG